MPSDYVDSPEPNIQALSLAFFHLPTKPKKKNSNREFSDKGEKKENSEVRKNKKNTKYVGQHTRNKQL